MGLDKWLKPEDQVKKEVKKQESSDKVRESSNRALKEEMVGKHTIKLKKYTLICPNTKCKYQKTIMKKILTEIDRKCPRCDQEMKIKGKII